MILATWGVLMVDGLTVFEAVGCLVIGIVFGMVIERNREPKK